MTELNGLDAAEKGMPDLGVILAAWDDATERLRRSHEKLRDEVSRLSEELTAKNRELARKNRLADLGLMASHVAHEVRNSMAPMTLYVSLLRRRLAEDTGSLAVLKNIELSLSNLETTVNDLLHFTRDRDPQWRPFDLHGLLEEVCQSLRPQFEAQRVRVDLDAPRPLEFGGSQGLGDPDMIRRAVLNLLLNALDAMPDGGQIVITAWNGPTGLEVEVADSGPGVAPENSERVFEPFFTTKSGGTGLGLAIVHRIAEAHGGRAWVRNCPEGGAAFTIRIPRPAARAAA